MQESSTEQMGAMDAVQATMKAYLDVALMQAEILPKMLQGLRTGSNLSLAIWRETFEATHRTLDHISKAVALAEEIFDEHEEEMSGALSEEMTCDEFQCLTWKK